MRAGAEQGTLSSYSTALWLGVELAKPFSIAAAFDAFQSSRFGQGAAVALLGLVAGSYSLSAEISLRVSMLSDRVAERAATSNIANNVLTSTDGRNLSWMDCRPHALSANVRRSLLGCGGAPQLSGNDGIMPVPPARQKLGFSAGPVS